MLIVIMAFVFVMNSKKSFVIIVVFLGTSSRSIDTPSR